ncbi:MAG: hypothetical protein FWD06_05590 [Oscillospiraceae bacterium]|nr:hypothetical protein [Oscillospiraceae bacterium]
MKKLLCFALALVLSVMLFVPAMAQDYPEQPQWPTLTVYGYAGFTITVGDAEPQHIVGSIALQVEPGTSITLTSDMVPEIGLGGGFWGWESFPWGDSCVWAMEQTVIFIMPDEDMIVFEVWLSISNYFCRWYSTTTQITAGFWRFLSPIFHWLGRWFCNCGFMAR